MALRTLQYPCFGIAAYACTRIAVNCKKGFQRVLRPKRVLKNNGSGDGSDLLYEKIERRHGAGKELR